MSERVLVLGGTGHFGRHIVEKLQQKGASVSILTRNMDRARSLWQAPVNLIEGDITDSDSIERSLNEIDRLVISISAFSPRLIRQLRRIEQTAVLEVLDTAKTMGTTRVVYISVYDLRLELAKECGMVSGEIKHAVEEALSRSGFNWTVLGASPSMDMFFAMIRGESMMVPGGGPPALPTIAAADVAEIAAQSVLRDDLHGRRFRMTGPEALSFPQAAQRISEVWGKPISMRSIPLFPIRLVSFLAQPFYPFLRHLYASICLMNRFPQDLIHQAQCDHKLLVETFQYSPTTLEMEAQRLKPI